MGLRQVVVLLAVVLALSVLAYLLRMTAGPSTDMTLLTQLAAGGQANAAVDAELTDALREFEGPPQPLAESAQKLAAEQGSIGEQILRLPQPSATVRAAAQRYAGAVTDKLAKLATFQQQRVAYGDGLRRMQQMTLDLQAMPGKEQLPPAVATLTAEVRTYGNKPDAAHRPGLIKQIAQVKAGAAQANETQRPALMLLGDSAVAALSARDRAQAAAAPVHAAPVPRTLEALRFAYSDEQRAARAQAERYRLILVIYALALLGAFGLIGMRLRHSIGALDSANAELQHNNVNLEKIVEQRTGELRKAMGDLRQQQAQLIQSEKMASLGQMVAGVAHEINTPLGYATSNVSVVRESLDSLRGNPSHEESLTEFGALLADAEHGLSQIAELVLSLKNFSRVDRSRADLFDVNEGLDTALKICQNQIKGRIEVERHYGELPRIQCAPSQINQVFLNILNNAGQSIDGNGRIVIRTREAGDEVEIAIRDSGCGMDAQTQAHIFEPFFTTKDVGQGTGLGLTIVFRIIEDHRGRIAVNSAPGQGTEFVITLPKKGTKTPPTATTSPQLAAA